LGQLLDRSAFCDLAWPRIEGNIVSNDRENVLICRLHLWAALRRAELGDRTVQQIDLVVEIDHVDSEPLVLVLALGQLDHLAQGATAQRRLGILAQLVGCVAFTASAGPKLVPGSLVAVREKSTVLVVVYAQVYVFTLNMNSGKEDAYTVVIKEVILRAVDRSVVLVADCVCG
jgi:hypothetical protein